MVRQLFLLRPGELRRLGPFFAFYLLLFTMLSLGDGLSLSLFVHQVGVRHLPVYYAIAAVVNVLMMGLYIRWSRQVANLHFFHVIIGSSVLFYWLAWAFIQNGHAQVTWYGLFFIGREISFNLVLLHFGGFLRDYFTQEESGRIMPIVYSAGRVGGMVGNVLLGALAERWGVLNLALVYCLLGFLCHGFVILLKGIPALEEPADPEAKPQESPVTQLAHFLRQSPFLQALSAVSLVFFIFRWLLHYQYNTFFETHFESDAAMASFLGWYGAISLGLGAVIQLFVVGRLIQWLGVMGCHQLYAAIMLFCSGLNMVAGGLWTAVFSRAVESELRIVLRNPVQQLLTNEFSKQRRKLARAWTMGILAPVGTVICAIGLGFLAPLPATLTGYWLPVGLLATAVMYGVVSQWLYQTHKSHTASHPG
ncbi:MAG: MFS transporter [Candidatus Melainabacteria bacterium]|nr:MFS transporter [Candidatus Melainabacteria bacterium]